MVLTHFSHCTAATAAAIGPTEHAADCIVSWPIRMARAATL